MTPTSGVVGLPDETLQWLLQHRHVMHNSGHITLYHAIRIRNTWETLAKCPFGGKKKQEQRHYMIRCLSATIRCGSVEFLTNLFSNGLLPSHTHGESSLVIRSNQVNIEDILLLSSS